MNFIPALVGPRLYRIYGRHSYEPNFLESSGDKMFSIGNCLYSICAAMSPLLVPYILFTWPPSSYSSAAKVAATFYAVAYSLRTCGRLANPDYAVFIDLLKKAKSGDGERRTALKRYDFQIFAAPADFSAKPAQGKWFANLAPSQSRDLREPLNSLRAALAWIAANTFGRRMLYPGSLAVFHSLVNGQLIEGRRKLIEERAAQRNVVRTEDGNAMDSVFVDNRGKGTNGDTLVIVCDGNAGFYEIGVMKTPTDMQYSVLGWNMPGFAESTGTPYPKSILLGMEAIMQFAVHKLGFKPEQIVLFAWSIGGFPATWAAANYPQIRALILDASFDDLVPLAIAKMPSSIDGLVRYTVQKHLNLPISEQLNHYQGPVRLIRRWDDEIIVTDERSEDQRRASNRANWLLLKLLRNRYPALVNSQEDEQCIFDWLDQDPQERLINFPPEDSMEPAIGADTNIASLDRAQRNRLIRQLCTKYFVDYMGAPHNTPLRPEYFNIPE